MSPSAPIVNTEDVATRALSGDELAAGPSPTRVVLQILLIVLAVVTLVWALHRLERVVLLLILAVFFAYLIAPIVEFAQRPIRIAGTERRLSRGLAIGIIYLVILGSASIGAAIALPRVTQQIGDAVAQAPVYATSLRAWEQRWAIYYKRLNLPADVRQSLGRSVGASDTIIEYARRSLMVLVGGLAYLPWLVLVPVLAFFLLKDAETFRRTALLALPHRLRLRGHRLFEDLNEAFAAYIRAQFLACVLVGTICGVGFAVLGMQYPVLLGVFAGVLEFIPLVGPLIVAAGAAIIAGLQAPILVLWVCGFLAILRVVEDYVIYPRLIGRGLHLHPLAVIVAVLVGVELGGVAGIFLAVPVIALVSVAGRHWLEWRGADGVASERPGSE
ncbi:MAG: AI-2E family transporter [Gemmatimonadaceae bacterium]